jgi:hypothetical protein
MVANFLTPQNVVNKNMRRSLSTENNKETLNPPAPAINYGDIFNKRLGRMKDEEETYRSP